MQVLALHFSASTQSVFNYWIITCCFNARHTLQVTLNSEPSGHYRNCSFTRSFQNPFIKTWILAVLCLNILKLQQLHPQVTHLLTSEQLGRSRWLPPSPLTTTTVDSPGEQTLQHPFHVSLSHQLSNVVMTTADNTVEAVSELRPVA